MNKETMLEKTKEYVKKNMNHGEPGHDWHHIERVWKMARRIGEEENADMFIVEMGALLHDIADWKFHGPGANENKAREWMASLNANSKDTEQIIHIIEHISFKGSGEKEKMQSLEGKVVQDADRLDAMGAIGIARAFTFSGHRNIPIFVPGIEPRKNITFDVYKETEKSAINHFYEKLLLIKDRMNTPTGKKLAENRHKFTEKYLEQFFKEVSGEN